jgi:hypothetical protein
MDPNQIFSIANTIALCGWLLIVVLPRNRWAAHILAGIAIPVAFAALYIVLIALHFPGSNGGFSSLPDVGRLFADPWLLLAGWLHYLAFDLLVGSWEVRDARDRGLNHLVVVPCLIMTFLFGPAGWLLYLGVRSGTRRTAQQPER